MMANKNEKTAPFDAVFSFLLLIRNMLLMQLL